LSVSHQAELRSAAPALLRSLSAIVGQQRTLRDTTGEHDATFSRSEDT
jgi:hypothetical protein